MANRGPLLGVAALLAVLGVGTLVGGVVGVGPLAATTPPDQVTDPGEMAARSLQATLDAFSVHLDATLSGTVPGSLGGRPETQIVLDGTTVSADLKPKDAKTQVSVTSPALDFSLDTVTVWDAVWSRNGPDQPWSKASIGSVAASTGLDINPLTLVDRVRVYLAEAGHRPTVRDVPCAGESGTCRHVVINGGADAAALLGALLSGGSASALAAVHTTITVDADSATLRPARVVLDMTNDDGTVDLHLVIDASKWDEPVRIEEPPSGS